MATLYKLTDENSQTRGGTQWGENVSHSGTGEGKLCGPGYIHAYEHPLLAALLNPIHAGFSEPQLWEAEGEIALRDGHLKCGCVTLTTIRRIDMPTVTTEQRVRFAILCALEVYDAPRFVAWANAWLSGEDRSATAAREAASAAWVAAALAAAWATEAAAAWTAATEAAAARAAATEAAAARAEIDLIALAVRACEAE